MTIRAPRPHKLPPSAVGSAKVSYGITRREVSEGQMLKEGEAVADLVIEDPLRLWTQVPEDARRRRPRRPARPGHDADPS